MYDAQKEQARLRTATSPLPAPPTPARRPYVFVPLCVFSSASSGASCREARCYRWWPSIHCSGSLCWPTCVTSAQTLRCPRNRLHSCAVPIRSTTTLCSLARQLVLSQSTTPWFEISCGHQSLNLAVERGNGASSLPPLDWKAVGVTSSLLTFFLLFYANNCASNAPQPRPHTHTRVVQQLYWL